jgi:predicted DNA-binding transcriptional regulator YafY
MLAMTVLLLSRGRVTAKEMAERFEVSVRTIYRDIEAMNVAGIPVVSYQGGGGGYGLVENFTLDRQLLSFDGMLSILTALRGINDTLDDAALRDAIETFRALLPPDKREDSPDHEPEFVVDLSPWGLQSVYKERLSTVQRALSTRRLLSFDYQGAGAKPMRRTVEPTTVVFKGHSWYLYAFCRLRTDFRLFRLSRMRNLEILEERYRRRRGSYELEFTEDAPFGASDVAPTRFVLHFAAHMRSIVEDSFDPSHLEIHRDGSVTARFEMPEDNWVYGMILSYGTSVEVLEPDRVRQVIGKAAKNIASLYEPDREVSQQ